MPPDNPGSLNARAMLRAWCLMLLLFATAALLALPHKTEAAVQYGNATSLGFHCSAGTNCNNGTFVVSPLTAPAITGSNTVLIIGLSMNGGSPTPPTSVTYDGVEQGSPDFDSGVTTFGRTLAWIIINPSSAKNIVVDFDQGWNGVVMAAYYTGVNQATPYRTPTTGTGADNPASLSVTNSAARDVIFGFFSIHDTSAADGLTSARVGAGQTYRLQTVNASAESQLALSDEPGASGSVTHSWDFVDGGVDWAGLAVPLIPSRGAILKPPNNLGLVGYWSFNEGTSTVATDFSGNGNTGTLENSPTWINGKRGKGLGLEGATDRVTMSNSSTLAPPSVSFGGWVKFNDLTTADQFIISRNDGLGGYRMSFDDVGAECAADALCAWINEDGDRPLSYAGSNLKVGTWYHVMATYDGVSVFTLYVNGTAVASDSGLSGTIDYSNTAFCLGNMAGSASTCDQSATNFNGSIDEIRIYNRALTAAQVAALYGSGAVKFTTSSVNLQAGSTLANGLVGHWTFDGADTQTTISDRSGSNNHGYFIGGATSSAKVIGKLGQALNFNGSSSYVDLGTGSGLSLPGAMTACAWIYPRSVGGAEAVIISRGESGAANIQYSLEIETTLEAGVFWNQSNGFPHVISTNPVITLNAWTHVCIARNSSTAGTVYVNGASVPTTVSSGAIPSPSVTAYIGASGAVSSLWDGPIDDLRLYNRALSPAEVAQLYGLGKVRITQ